MSTTRYSAHRRRRKRHHSKKYNRLKRNLAGKLIVLLQLIVSSVFVGAVCYSGLVPVSYLVALSVVLVLLFGILFGLQFIRGNVYIAGIVISVLVSMALAVGTFFMVRTSQMMSDVGGATYKTDNMIVVVRKDDPSMSLSDAADYKFGIQTSLDQENTQKMVDNVEGALDAEINTAEYETVQDAAQALLNGEIGAAIYNEAFTGVIEESIEDYSDQVRILYQFSIDTTLEQEEKNVDEPFNIYISGIDVSGSITTNSRSDVNIIMTVNPNTHKILLTTTPRDYYVTIPGVSGGQRDKLTHAGIYGVDVSMATLENIYGIDITYYARVNFTSLIKIVDALGGIDVYSEYAFEARGHEFEVGVNHMNGEQALAFSRERYSFEDGDNQRGKNQEAVLTAILQKAMSPAILIHASELITSVSDSVETNMTRAEMAKFVNQQLLDRSSWEIESVAATGRGDSQVCYSSGSQQLYVMWPDDAVTVEISEKMKQVMEGKE